MTEQRPGGHFDRFNFCNATPEYVVENVAFVLDGQPPDQLAGIQPETTQNSAYCNVEPITVTGFLADAVVSGPGGTFNIHYEHHGVTPLKQIVIGVMQSCHDDAAQPPEPGLPVGFGEVYSNVAGPDYKVIDQIV